MVERQQALAAAILADPAVASLSSFIGVDGTNTTLNSGRIQINLKPFDERRVSAQDVIPTPAERSRPPSMASRCSCSRCRISRSRIASAARSINTRWKMRTPRN